MSLVFPLLTPPLQCLGWKFSIQQYRIWFTGSSKKIFLSRYFSAKWMLAEHFDLDDLGTVMEEECKCHSKSSSPWEHFSAWIHCICVVTFDLEIGQAMEVCFCDISCLSNYLKILLFIISYCALFLKWEEDNEIKW